MSVTWEERHSHNHDLSQHKKQTMSSSSLTPLSPYTDNNTLTKPRNVRLLITLITVNNEDPTEHNVTRYAILIIIIFFSLNIWNFVLQFYTQSGKWPDLVLEIFTRRPGRERDILFVSRVFMEFRTAVNTKAAIKQLVESMSSEFGANFKSKRFLIGDKGNHPTTDSEH